MKMTNWMTLMVGIVCAVGQWPHRQTALGGVFFGLDLWLAGLAGGFLLAQRLLAPPALGGDH